MSDHTDSIWTCPICSPVFWDADRGLATRPPTYEERYAHDVAYSRQIDPTYDPPPMYDWLDSPPTAAEENQ